MKMTKLTKSALILICSIFFIGTVYAQNTKKDKKAAKILALEKIIDTANFTFSASMAYPQHGNSKELSSGYTFKVTNGVAKCSLPYFGQAYIASMNQDDSGIDFNTSHYDYYYEKKDFGWDILIKPNNTLEMKDVKQIIITVKTTGEATLQISFTNRERMTYDGDIEKYKEE